MDSSEDYYATLELKSDASADAIKKSFQRLIKKVTETLLAINTEIRLSINNNLILTMLSLKPSHTYTNQLQYSSIYLLMLSLVLDLDEIGLGFNATHFMAPPLL